MRRTTVHAVRALLTLAVLGFFCLEGLYWCRSAPSVVFVKKTSERSRRLFSHPAVRQHTAMAARGIALAIVGSSPSLEARSVLEKRIGV